MFTIWCTTENLAPTLPSPHPEPEPQNSDVYNLISLWSPKRSPQQGHPTRLPFAPPLHLYVVSYWDSIDLTSLERKSRINAFYEPQNFACFKLSFRESTNHVFLVRFSPEIISIHRALPPIYLTCDDVPWCRFEIKCQALLPAPVSPPFSEWPGAQEIEGWRSSFPT